MRKAKRIEFQILKDNVSAKEDKRVFCRFALDNVPVRFKDLKIGEKGTTVCRDISGGGACVESAQGIKPHTPLELWFDLPDGFEPMHLLGKVAWSHQLSAGWRMGISFDRPKLMGMSRILKMETSAVE